MGETNFTFAGRDGERIFVYKWCPEGKEPKAIVQIAHGLVETAARYRRLAEALTANGFLVYANDHRGHGQTAPSLEEVGYWGEDGFNASVENLAILTRLIKKENPDLPLFLFGHSMGSFFAQNYLTKYGEGLCGVILSGSNDHPGPALNLGIAIARRELAKSGPRPPSPKLHQLSFGAYNKGFKPARTAFDWLSRDEEEVDKSINDPYCGGIASVGLYYDLFCGLKETYKKKNRQRIPEDLPVYIFSGAKDPVGRNGKGVRKLVRSYQKLEIKDLTYKIYQDGRHEMLNELNRDRVIKDLLTWLARQMPKERGFGG
jgi:alpha-beta hydrolase superfamily lysophospholipase